MNSPRFLYKSGDVSLSENSTKETRRVMLGCITPCPSGQVLDSTETEDTYKAGDSYLSWGAAGCGWLRGGMCAWTAG